MLRSQGLTQQQVAEEMGVAQKTVSNLENVSKNKPDNIRIKSTSTLPTPKPPYGTPKTHTIARLKRDGHADLAQQVESGQLPAAARLTCLSTALTGRVFFDHFGAVNKMPPRQSWG